MFENRGYCRCLGKNSEVAKLGREDQREVGTLLVYAAAKRAFDVHKSSLRKGII